MLRNSLSSCLQEQNFQLLTGFSNAVSHPSITKTSNTSLWKHKSRIVFHKGPHNFAYLLKCSSCLNNEDNTINTSHFVWVRNQLDVTYVLSFISPLQAAQHVSGNHVPIFRSWRLRSVIATCWYCAVTMSGVIATCWYCAVTMSGVIQICLSVWVDMFYACLVCGKSRCICINISVYVCKHIWIIPLIVTTQYQLVAIKLRSRQHLKMRTWLPETCWATCKGEIKDNTKVTSSWFLTHTESRFTVNHTSDLLLILLSIQTTFCLITCTEGKLPYIEFIITGMNKWIVVIHALESVKNWSQSIFTCYPNIIYYYHIFLKTLKWSAIKFGQNKSPTNKGLKQLPS
jgi:hypothetical protein